MHTREFVVEYLVERGADLDEKNYGTYDFLKSGVIDSFETMAFLLSIEEILGVRIEPEDFLNKELRYVSKLVAYLDARVH